MDYIKKHKYVIVVLVLFLLLVIVGVQAKNLFFPNDGKAVYGDRLDGKVKVDPGNYDNLKDDIKKNDKVSSVSATESGRQIKVFITVQNTVSPADAKAIGSTVTKYFNESQIGYYDFEVFLTKEDKTQNNFPIIGYKHHNSSEFSWTKDREITSNSSEGDNK